MRLLRIPVIAAGLASVLALPADAHSLKEVEQQLLAKERAFQPVGGVAPGFTLRDAAGRTHRLADYRGKVVVLNFVYATCPDVCPRHADRIAALQSMINATPMKSQVQFITVTTDPVNDSPAVLRSFGEGHGLQTANWTFLTTLPAQPSDATTKLAAAYGLKFTPMDGGMQMHAAVTHVIDQEGRLRARFHGLRFGTTNFVVYVNALVNKAHAPHPHAGDEPSLWDRVKGWFA